MDFMKDWKTWRSSITDAVQLGRKFGMSDEEALLKKLLNVAFLEERKTLGNLIFKLIG